MTKNKSSKFLKRRDSKNRALLIGREMFDRANWFVVSNFVIEKLLLNLRALIGGYNKGRYVFFSLNIVKEVSSDT